MGRHIHAVVDAIADIDVKPPRLTRERFVTGGAAAVAVTGGVVLGIRLGFHHHTPEQAAVVLAFQQQAADEFWGNDLYWAGKGREGLGKRGRLWEWLSLVVLSVLTAAAGWVTMEGS